MCDWLDDSTLAALLSASTAAAPGMRVGLRPNVLWPLAYTGPGCKDVSSTADGTMCAAAQALTVDSLFPCDRAETEEREQCIMPTAIIQAPTELSSCANARLILDASRSTGGGVQPLKYTWSAQPRTCDQYYQVSSALAAAVGDGSKAFVMMLDAALAEARRQLEELPVERQHAHRAKLARAAGWLSQQALVDVVAPCWRAQAVRTATSDEFAIRTHASRVAAIRQTCRVRSACAGSRPHCVASDLRPPSAMMPS